MLKVKDRAELEAALEQSGTSLKDVQRQFTEKTIAGEWLRQRMPKPKPITHEDMLAYYQDHLKEYEYPTPGAVGRADGAVRPLRRRPRRRVAGAGRDGQRGVDARSRPIPTLRGPVFAEVAKAKSHGFTAADGGASRLDDARRAQVRRPSTTRWPRSSSAR